MGPESTGHSIKRHLGDSALVAPKLLFLYRHLMTVGTRTENGTKMAELACQALWRARTSSDASRRPIALEQ